MDFKSNALLDPVTLLIDLDPAIYMAGFAAQKSEYHVVYSFDDDEGYQEKWFKDGRKKQEFLKEIGDGRYGELVIHSEEKVVTAQPEGFARQALHTTYEGIIRQCERHFKTKALSPWVYITGDGNFREEVATIQEYKGNRKLMDKPVHYQACRDYAHNVLGARIIEGMEADDAVSIAAHKLYMKTPEKFVVVTIDKDLDQIPGLHYDYQKKVFYEVDPLDGELFFYEQCLTGDVTDNIPGLYKVGKEKASRMISDWFDEAAAQGIDFRVHIWGNIIKQYELNMERYPDKYPEGITAEEAATENARLVYMLQKEGETWTPPQLG